jgi:hypothetical protein
VSVSGEVDNITITNCQNVNLCIYHGVSADGTSRSERRELYGPPRRPAVGQSPGRRANLSWRPPKDGQPSSDSLRTGATSAEVVVPPVPRDSTGHQALLRELEAPDNRQAREDTRIHQGPVRLAELKDCDTAEEDLILLTGVLSREQQFQLSREIRQSGYRLHVISRAIVRAFGVAVQMARRRFPDKVKELEQRELFWMSEVLKFATFVKQEVQQRAPQT